MEELKKSIEEAIRLQFILLEDFGGIVRTSEEVEKLSSSIHKNIDSLISITRGEKPKDYIIFEQKNIKFE